MTLVPSTMTADSLFQAIQNNDFNPLFSKKNQKIIPFDTLSPILTDVVAQISPRADSATLLDRLVTVIPFDDLIREAKADKCPQSTTALLAHKVASNLIHNRPLGNLNQISDFSPKVLISLLEKVAEYLADIENPEPAMKQLASILKEDKFDEAIRTIPGWREYKNAVSFALANKEDAAKDLQTMDPKFHVSAGTRIASAFRSLLDLVESILDAFGLAEFFTPSGNSEAASRKAQKVLALLSLFTLCSTILVPIIGGAMVGGIVGGLLVVIGILSVVYPKFKPTPRELQMAHNWTYEYLNGRLGDMPQGRDDFAKRIFEIMFIRNEHVILVGKSGQGKTEIIKLFVKYLADREYLKDFKELPLKLLQQLRSMTVFYSTMGDLLSYEDPGGGGNRIVEHRAEQIGPNVYKVVQVFDEFQALFVNPADPASQAMKRPFETDKPNSFKHAIALTTDREYDQYIKNDPTWVRRFTKIEIPDTEDHQTRSILQSFILKKAPWLIATKDNVDFLIKKVKEKFTDAPHPKKPVDILKLCIEAAGQSRNEKTLQEKIDSILAEGVRKECENDLFESIREKLGLSEDVSDNTQLINSLREWVTKFQNAAKQDNHDHSLCHGRDSLFAGPQKKEDSNELRAKLHQIFENKKRQIAHFSKIVDNLGTFKKKKYEAIIRVTSGRRWLSRKEKNSLLLTALFLNPALETLLKTKAPSGVRVQLDENLINQMIETTQKSTQTQSPSTSSSQASRVVAIHPSASSLSSDDRSPLQPPQASSTTPYPAPVTFSSPPLSSSLSRRASS